MNTYQRRLADLVIAEFQKTHKISDHMWKLYKYDCRCAGNPLHWHKHRSRKELETMMRWAFGLK